MNRRSAIVTATGILLPGCGSRTTSTSSTPSISEAVEILDHEFVNGEPVANVVGTVRNVSEQQIPYLHLSVKFFENDTRFDSSAGHVDDLSPGVTAEFRAKFFGPDPSRVTDYTIEINPRKSVYP
jgi:hypothetical protein